MVFAAITLRPGMNATELGGGLRTTGPPSRTGTSAKRPSVSSLPARLFRERTPCAGYGGSGFYLRGLYELAARTGWMPFPNQGRLCCAGLVADPRHRTMWSCPTAAPSGPRARALLVTPSALAGAGTVWAGTYAATTTAPGPPGRQP